MVDGGQGRYVGERKGALIDQKKTDQKETGA
jgi:hypothetical protein